MSVAQNEQIKDAIEFNKRFSELSEHGQIMTLAYLSALHDKELTESVSAAGPTSPNR